MKTLPKRPTKTELVYSEWDDEFEVWGVFGLDSGHCYAQFYTKDQAQEYEREHNQRVEK